MKGALIYILLLSCIMFSVRSYDPLLEHLKARSLKTPLNFAEEDVEETEHSSSSSSYFSVYVGPQEGLKVADRIIELPGQPNGIGFDQYSGYATVDPTAGRALFYYFAESLNRSSFTPLVLWLNGGPGYSSIGDGAMTELGPFRVNADGKTLWRNPYSWNTVANVLFLESPAGVGFSYSNTTSDYVTGDEKTAKDSYTFLVNWLEKFPEYKKRNFFLDGESYAGHYVPQLAQLILKNKKITNQTIINLKGIAIGNHKGVFDYMWMHSLISDEIYEAVVSNCNFSSEAPASKACDSYRVQAYHARGPIDDYNIYAFLCSSSASSPNTPIPVSEFDPCSSNYVFTYLNTPEVQKSLHANTTGIPGPWLDCVYIWKDGPDSVLPIIKKLTKSGIRVWLYSGDTDSSVPVTTTKYVINKMGFSVKTPWYPWYTHDEVGDYAVEYENLTFVTERIWTFCS